MKKTWIIVSVCGILLAGCSVNASTDTGALTIPKSQQQVANNETISGEEQELTKAYSLALDTLLSLDHGWDKDMEYISIDLENVQGVAESGLTVITDNLEKNNVEVHQLSLNELEDQGLANDKGVLDGVLLRIDEAKLTADKKLTVKGKITKSAKQSLGATIELQQNNGVWEVRKTTITTES